MKTTHELPRELTPDILNVTIGPFKAAIWSWLAATRRVAHSLAKQAMYSIRLSRTCRETVMSPGSPTLVTPSTLAYKSLAVPLVPI